MVGQAQAITHKGRREGTGWHTAAFERFEMGYGKFLSPAFPAIYDDFEEGVQNEMKRVFRHDAAAINN